MSLPAFKVTTSSGHSWVTSMAKGVTLADAKKYFLGKRFDVSGDPEREKMERAVKVEEVSKNPSKNQTLYEELRAASVPLDHHESDLYVLATPEAHKIIRKHKAKGSAFTSQVDGKTWIDVPFAYEPFWAKRAKNPARRGHRVRRNSRGRNRVRRKRKNVSLFYRRRKRRVANPRRRGMKTYTTFYPSMKGFVSTVKKGGKHVYDGPAKSTRRGAAKAAIAEAKRKGYLNPRKRRR